MWKILRNAILATILSALVAVVVNAARPGGIDWIAKSEYEILVPCPETTGRVAPITQEELDLSKKGDILVDSRPAKLFAKGSLPNAINIPYDYLEAVSEKEIRDLLKMKAKRVIVIGDGQKPDSGEQLAKELAGSGIRNIYFISGGFGKAEEANNEAK